MDPLLAEIALEGALGFEDRFVADRTRKYFAFRRAWVRMDVAAA